MATRITALFSKNNIAHQPENNLIAFWMGVPTFENIQWAIKHFNGLGDSTDEHINSILAGELVDIDNIEYRLEIVIEGLVH